MSKRTVCIWAPALLVLACMLTGCVKPKEAIVLSKTILDFGRDTSPITMRVWNANPDAGTITIALTPSHSWIKVEPQQVTCAPPNAAGGPYDEKTITVRLDRTQLTAGTYQGEGYFIKFSARGIVAKTVAVQAIQDQDGTPPGKLNFLGTPEPTYSEPYLLDFSFALVDDNGDPIVADPAQFQVTARENGLAVSSETGVHLRRNAARQLKMFLVLDYSLSMQEATGAINAMQDAAQQVLLPALNADALVGVYEFHRDDLEPAEVIPLTTDKELVSQSIDDVQSEFVGGFASGSRLWDAVVTVAGAFSSPSIVQEERIIVIFSDGNDTSSRDTVDDAINAVQAAGAKVYALGFGPNVDETNLLLITASTGGQVLPTAATAQLEASFQELVDRLGAQYVLRWATLQRRSVAFQPSFLLTLANDSISHAETLDYKPTDHEGNVLEGVLRLVPSENMVRTTVFLRAEYVPRQVDRIRMYVKTQVGFEVSGVGAVDDGLIPNSTLTATPDEVNGGVWIDFRSTAGPIPFASFGPLLKFDFDGVVPETTPLFDQVYVDPSIYADGQSFSVLGYPNTPPGS